MAGRGCNIFKNFIQDWLARRIVFTFSFLGHHCLFCAFILKKGTKKPPSWWHYFSRKDQFPLMRTMRDSSPVENCHES